MNSANMLKSGTHTAPGLKLFTASRCTTRPNAHRQLVQPVLANKGFGDSNTKASKKAPKLAKYLETPVKTAAGDSAGDDGWFVVPDLNAETSFVSKPIQPIILATGKAIMLYKVDGTVYCTDANSTAYQYPLADANLLSIKGKPAVEVKLDGTVYDLATGKVISWCPKNGPVRSLLGSLKDKTEPIDLPVFPVKIQKDGKITVKLSK